MNKKTLYVYIHTYGHAYFGVEMAMVVLLFMVKLGTATLISESHSFGVYILNIILPHISIMIRL